MEIPIVDIKLQNQLVEEDIIKEIVGVIKSGNYILGNQEKSFEKEFAEYFRVPYAIGVASGTDALVIALEALGIGIGDEVITTAFSFFATAECIARVGATPVFVDVCKDTYNINPQLIEEKITSKTKAIIPVHLYGQCADMDEIMRIARKFNLYVVEDTAQAAGATFKGRYAGTIGDIGCFSFFPTKNLSGMGDGGMIVTGNQEFEKRIRKLRVHGMEKKYIHPMVGYNSRLDELQAAILRVKLPYLKQWNQQRYEIASYYAENMKSKTIQTPYEADFGKHIYHLYNIQFESELRRDIGKQQLLEKGIHSMVYYPKAMHLQEAFHGLGYKEGSCEVAEALSKQLLAIPLYPGMPEKYKKYVVEAVNEL